MSPPFDLIALNKSVLEFSRQGYINNLLGINDQIREFGLSLTLNEATELITCRENNLRDNNRIEIGIGALGKIIEKFATSAYVPSGEFAYEIERILELFYFVKTEIEDSLSDNQLIDMFFNFYEYQSAGSVELLSGICVDEIIRNYNCGNDITQPVIESKIEVGDCETIQNSDA